MVEEFNKFLNLEFMTISVVYLVTIFLKYLLNIYLKRYLNDDVVYIGI